MLSSFKTILATSSLCLITLAAQAASVDDLSPREASSGLKAALERGADVAVSQLGVSGGFLNNDKVKIPLPKVLEQAAPLLKMTGRGQQLDDLVVAMNRAAEAAVPMAKPLLMNAIKGMTFTDAKSIVMGGDNSVTQFFRDKTSAQLATKFLPLVKATTDRAGLASMYNNTVSQVGKFAQIPPEQKTVELYVTQRAMDGLFAMIGEEERKIRQNPAAAGSAILSKVFSFGK